MSTLLPGSAARVDIHYANPAMFQKFHPIVRPARPVFQYDVEHASAETIAGTLGSLFRGDRRALLRGILALLRMTVVFILWFAVAARPSMGVGVPQHAGPDLWRDRMPAGGDSGRIRRIRQHHQYAHQHAQEFASVEQLGQHGRNPRKVCRR